LLALRCAQAIRPYLPGDTNSDTDPTAVSILIDTPLTLTHISNAAHVLLPSPPSHLPLLDVTVAVNGKTLVTANVPLNTSAHPLPFSLSLLSPQSTAFTMTCTATLSQRQLFRATGSLIYLPENPSGSVTKMDLRTGAVLARPPNGKGNFAPVFPIGFYTQVDDYLAKDLTIPATLAKQGCFRFHFSSRQLTH